MYSTATTSAPLALSPTARLATSLLAPLAGSLDIAQGQLQLGDTGRLAQLLTALGLERLAALVTATALARNSVQLATAAAARTTARLSRATHATVALLVAKRLEDGVDQFLCRLSFRPTSRRHVYKIFNLSMDIILFIT